MEAKFSLLNHLQDQLNINPFISDILWLKGLSEYDLKCMRGNQPDNALPLDFTFRDFICAVLEQTQVRGNASRETFLDSFSGGEKEYSSIVDLFSAERKPQGLTKLKFELLSQSDANIESLRREVGSKLTIVKGRAGTGKTVQLLQLAFLLADEDNANRCLILTYNKVSDIQRRIDFTPMPSKIDGRTVSIQTIHSFFQTLMKETGVQTARLIPTNKNYERDYNNGLSNLYSFIVDKCNNEDISVLKDMAESPIDWDYILIDEAQDFSDLEKKILFKIYGPTRLIVADGVDQFMRTGHRQVWERNIDKSLIRMPKEMTLERRQKANLVDFVNAFAKSANLTWSVSPNTKLPGGTIEIHPEFRLSTYKSLHQNCQKNGCENYDILILAPPSQVETDSRGNRHFAKADKLKELGIPIYDGINEQNRTTYPTKDQCRVYQYDSCRGLEGWCVVCYKFDELIQYKLDTYTPNDDALGLDPDRIKWREVLLWALMPLTRPIDTLIITISDRDSEISRILKGLADTYPEFIKWNLSDQ